MNEWMTEWTDLSRTCCLNFCALRSSSKYLTWQSRVKSAEKSEYFILQVNISYKGTSFISAYNCSEKYKPLVPFSRCWRKYEGIIEILSVLKPLSSQPAFLWLVHVSISDSTSPQGNNFEIPMEYCMLF